MAIPPDVDTYIANADTEAHPILNELRKIITETIPGAKEGISYGVPFYQYHGQFVGFSAYKKHVSFGYGSDVLDENETEALKNKGYKLGKGTLQIKFDQAVPRVEIEQILNARARMNEAKQ